MYTGASESKTASPAAAWVTLLLFSLSANALAANNSVTGCNDTDRPSLALVVSVDALSISLIEHITVESEADLSNHSQTLKPIEIRLQSDAPVMSLSPRVATLLDRIFEDSSGAEVPATERAKTTSAESSSPLADGQMPKPQVDDDQELQLPELQRRMYRRDI